MDRKNYLAVNAHIEKIMPLVERPAVGRLLPRPFLAATHGSHYADTIYLWDHHHMAMRFACAGRPEYLRYGPENLLHHQTAQGFTPNIVSARFGISMLRPPFHCQPFLMQGTLMYAMQTGDRKWLKSVYPGLQAYLHYYETHWAAPHGLFRWPLAMMSGYDNDVVTTFFQPDTIIPCDVNAWLHLEYRAAGRVARLLGRTTDVKEYVRKARELDAVNKVMWHSPAGSFSAWNLVSGRHQFSLGDEFVTHVGKYAFQTCSNLIPLYARMAGRSEAQEMIEKYVINEEHFFSPWGIRSLSRASEYYNNAKLGNPPRYGPHDRLTNSNWQGPVWIPLCYFMFHALLFYGYRKEAEELMDRTMKVLAGSIARIGSFTENFDGETGEPLYATEFASWNILADVMPAEMKAGKWIMDPVFEA